MLLSFIVYSGHALACEARHLSVPEYQKSTEMALKLHDALERYQPEVALLARVGSDLSAYGLTYSHVGFVRRNHPAGKWIVTHLLNHCKQATSSLFDEGLIPFFSDAPFLYQAQLLIPRPALQNELARLLANGEAESLHERRYSVIAHAGRTQYQNSNQWVLEVLAVAKSLFLPSDQRVNALRLATEQGYAAERIKLGVLKTLGAMLFSPNVQFSDHDNSGRYPVVSVRSIVNYLQKNNDLMTIKEINLQGEKTLMSSTAVEIKPHSRRPALKLSKPYPTNNVSQEAFWRK